MTDNMSLSKGQESVNSLIVNRKQLEKYVDLFCKNKTLKTEWDKTLRGKSLSSKGYYNGHFDKTVSSTPGHFLQIIKSMGRDIEMEIEGDEILFYGAILKYIPSPIPGRSILIRDEDFIDTIEKTKLAHIKTRYKEKREK